MKNLLQVVLVVFSTSVVAGESQFNETTIVNENFSKEEMSGSKYLKKSLNYSNRELTEYRTLYSKLKKNEKESYLLEKTFFETMDFLKSKIKEMIVKVDLTVEKLSKTKNRNLKYHFLKKKMKIQINKSNKLKSRFEAKTKVLHDLNLQMKKIIETEKALKELEKEKEEKLKREMELKKCQESSINEIGEKIIFHLGQVDPSSKKNLQGRYSVSSENIISLWHDYFTGFVVKSALESTNKKRSFESYVNKKIKREEYHYSSKEDRIYFQEILNIHESTNIFKTFHPSFKTYLKAMIKVNENSLENLSPSDRELVNPSSIAYFWIKEAKRNLKANIDKITKKTAKSKKKLEEYIASYLVKDCGGKLVEFPVGYWENHNIIDLFGEYRAGYLKQVRRGRLNKVISLGGREQPINFLLSKYHSLPLSVTKIKKTKRRFTTEELSMRKEYLEELAWIGGKLEGSFRNLTSKAEFNEYREYKKQRSEKKDPSCYRIHLKSDTDRILTENEFLPKIKDLGVQFAYMEHRDPYYHIYVGPFYSTETRDNYSKYLSEKIKEKGLSDLFHPVKAHQSGCFKPISHRNMLMKSHDFQSIISGR